MNVNAWSELEALTTRGGAADRQTLPVEPLHLFAAV